MLFGRMAERAGIEHRYSYLNPASHADAGSTWAYDFYQRGNFPTTAARMRLFESQAPALAAAAVEKLNLGPMREQLTHILITCCTGFSAPGLDLEIIARCRLPSSIERTMIGFMGCYAAINALKLARHIVRSEPEARVLVINLELCSLHLQETTNLDEILSFLILGDGSAASLVTADPVGFAMDSFCALLVPDAGPDHLGDWRFRFQHGAVWASARHDPDAMREKSAHSKRRADFRHRSLGRAPAGRCSRCGRARARS